MLTAGTLHICLVGGKGVRPYMGGAGNFKPSINDFPKCSNDFNLASALSFVPNEKTISLRPYAAVNLVGMAMRK